MSEIVHYKGTLKPTGKSLKDYMPQAEDEYDLPYQEAILIDDIVYEVSKEELIDSDIFLASKNDDGSIDFQVKYYNGGCSFDEAIDESLKKLKD